MWDFFKIRGLMIHFFNTMKSHAINLYYTVFSCILFIVLFLFLSLLEFWICTRFCLYFNVWLLHDTNHSIFQLTTNTLESEPFYSSSIQRIALQHTMQQNLVNSCNNFTLFPYLNFGVLQMMKGESLLQQKHSNYSFLIAVFVLEKG